VSDEGKKEGSGTRGMGFSAHSAAVPKPMSKMDGAAVGAMLAGMAVEEELAIEKEPSAEGEEEVELGADEEYNEGDNVAGDDCTTLCDVFVNDKERMSEAEGEEDEEEESRA